MYIKQDYVLIAQRNLTVFPQGIIVQYLLIQCYSSFIEHNYHKQQELTILSSPMTFKTIYTLKTPKFTS